MLIFCLIFFCSVEEAKDFSTDMLGTSLVVVHDTLVSCQDKDSELTRGEHGSDEVLELSQSKIEAGWDDATFVEAAVKVDNDFARTGIVNNLEVVDVAVSLHDAEEFDEHLRDGSQANL